jgi:hypothetical protein
LCLSLGRNTIEDLIYSRTLVCVVSSRLHRVQTEALDITLAKEEGLVVGLEKKEPMLISIKHELNAERDLGERPTRTRFPKPLAPARAVLPSRWTYCSAASGKRSGKEEGCEVGGEGGKVQVEESQ